MRTETAITPGERGATWIYHADITNGAGGAGAHIYTMTVAARSQIEVLYGSMFNGDTTDRNSTLEIEDGGGNRITRFFSRTHSAATFGVFPYAEDDFGSGVAAGGRYLLGGGMVLIWTLAAVALSQDSAFGLACQIRVGDVPTVVEVGASTPTININQEGIL